MRKAIIGVASFTGLMSALVLALTLMATPATGAPGVPRVLADLAAGPAYNCSAGTCDVTLNLLPYDVTAFTCYVYQASTAARNVTVTLYGDAGVSGQAMFTSTALSCASGTGCAVTVGPQATTAVANTAVVPVVPTRTAKVTVAAGGTTGNAVVHCVGR